MRITMLSAALAAVSLSQTVSAAAGSWLYTSDSTCGTGPDGQPTDPALVSHKFDINNAVCRRNEPKREYYWIPETKSHAPHCLHMSYEEACTSHDKEDDFEAYGECRKIPKGNKGDYRSYWYTKGKCSEAPGSRASEVVVSITMD